MNFVVYRESWRRGGKRQNHATYGDTRLLNPQQKMCCLGQIGYEAGVPLRCLRAYYPDMSARKYRESYGVWEYLGLAQAVDDRINSTALGARAASINDDDRDDKWREAELRILFKGHGHDLTFVDGVAPWFEEPLRFTPVTVLGMDLERAEYMSCTAEFGLGEDWATLYSIESKEPNHGDATRLLTEAKKHYEALGKRFGGSVALNKTMRGIYKKLGITEYVDEA